MNANSWTIGLIVARLIIAASATPVAAADSAIVIQGAAIFDSEHGTLLPALNVVIEGDRIKSITSSENSGSIPGHAQIIDATGKYLIPGLIDAHAHVVTVLNSARVTGDEILPLFLAYGVTSIRNTGDEIVAEKLVERYADAHPTKCPRVFLGSPLIDGDPPYHRDIGRALTDPEEVPKFVRDMKAWGVTTLKIYVRTERPVGRRVIEEAHRQGLTVAGHLGKYSAQDAVADGIDCLEHIWSVYNYIFPDGLPRMPGPKEQEKMTAADLEAVRRRILEQKANIDLGNPVARDFIATLARERVFVDPTLTVFRNMILLNDLPEVFEHNDNSIVPQRLREHWSEYRTRSNLSSETLELRKKEFRKYQELTGLLYRAGVPLLAGTDALEPFTPAGASLHLELELLVESGLSPAAALQAATINNASALKQSKVLGSISEGKLADLVILDANPLDDIRNTRKIWKVIKAGQLVDRELLFKAVPKL